MAIELLKPNDLPFMELCRERFRIAFPYACLKGIPVCVCDAQNAYVQAPSFEKNYVVCFLDFGLENAGKCAIVISALYGGKSAGAGF